MRRILALSAVVLLGGLGCTHEVCDCCPDICSNCGCNGYRLTPGPATATAMPAAAPAAEPIKQMPKTLPDAPKVEKSDAGKTVEATGVEE